MRDIYVRDRRGVYFPKVQRKKNLLLRRTIGLLTLLFFLIFAYFAIAKVIKEFTEPRKVMAKAEEKVLEKRQKCNGEIFFEEGYYFRCHALVNWQRLLRQYSSEERAKQIFPSMRERLLPPE